MEERMLEVVEEKDEKGRGDKYWLQIFQLDTGHIFHNQPTKMVLLLSTDIIEVKSHITSQGKYRNI